MKTLGEAAKLREILKFLLVGPYRVARDNTVRQV